MANYDEKTGIAYGVIILPKCRTVSRPIGDRTGENVPVVPEYERGDLP